MLDGTAHHDRRQRIRGAESRDYNGAAEHWSRYLSRALAGERSTSSPLRVVDLVSVTGASLATPAHPSSSLRRLATLAAAAVTVVVVVVAIASTRSTRDLAVSSHRRLSPRLSVHCTRCTCRYVTPKGARTSQHRVFPA